MNPTFQVPHPHPMWIFWLQFLNVFFDPVISKIFCPSKNLKLGKDGPLVVDIMQSKINGMFMLAAVLGYRTIIVGAFGCGAFHNPPQKVATYFKEAIDRYGHLFDEIVFAILTNNPAKNENYQAFYKAFH